MVIFIYSSGVDFEIPQDCTGLFVFLEVIFQFGAGSGCGFREDGDKGIIVLLSFLVSQWGFSARRS